MWTCTDGHWDTASASFWSPRPESQWPLGGPCVITTSGLCFVNTSAACASASVLSLMSWKALFADQALFASDTPLPTMTQPGLGSLGLQSVKFGRIFMAPSSAFSHSWLSLARQVPFNAGFRSAGTCSSTRFFGSFSASTAAFSAQSWCSEASWLPPMRKIHLYLWYDGLWKTSRTACRSPGTPRSWPSAEPSKRMSPQWRRMSASGSLRSWSQPWVSLTATNLRVSAAFGRGSSAVAVFRCKSTTRAFVGFWSCQLRRKQRLQRRMSQDAEGSRMSLTSSTRHM
mmetsp:Transcript_97538/g.284781  ORF Transcript_97538/g.284781 Transcript_97538/m.284781 type:complete len:285 (-) Transcript_97538:994-1848(-)